MQGRILWHPTAFGTIDTSVVSCILVEGTRGLRLGARGGLGDLGTWGQPEVFNPTLFPPLSLSPPHPLLFFP